ncbi:MAG: hypothetical protein PHE43_02725 [Candidatus Nanoarchaeia archaeon]|nr:hypothetical protein [Candidatus Nanoarchaeia archaeon]
MNNEFFKGIKEGFQSFGNLIAKAVNFILLFLVYIIAIGPTYLVSRLSKKYFLSIKKTKKDSYWIKKESGGEPIENYYRQF